jgi:hypothetical protein
MANGGVNYQNGVLFCSQGALDRPSSLIHMETEAPYQCTTILDSFYGRQFNSINDVVIHSDGSIWFTDPIYGFKQGYRPTPDLPVQVYRYDPIAKSVRVVADGFGRPNGISFSPDEKVVYVTDTDAVQGDGSVDWSRAATMSVPPHTLSRLAFLFPFSKFSITDFDATNVLTVIPLTLSTIMDSHFSQIGVSLLWQITAFRMGSNVILREMCIVAAVMVFMSGLQVAFFWARCLFLEALLISASKSLVRFWL